MRRKEDEITDSAVLEKLLSTATVCRIGIANDNMPYIVPMSYGYKDKTLYFHSADSGRKIDMMKANPHVCFEVEAGVEIRQTDNPCHWGVNYQSVIGYGDVSFIEDMKEKKAALNWLLNQYSDDEFDLQDASVEVTTVFKVSITSMTGKESK